MLPRSWLILSSVLMAFMVFLSGCCGMPGFGACETTDQIEIEASNLLNSCDDSGQHPVTVRIYGLKDTEAFMDAGFDQLWDNDLETLGDDRVNLIEKTVLPGQKLTLPLLRQGDVTALGIVVNFCQVDPGCWQQVITLDKNATQQTLYLDRTCLSLK